MCGVCVVWFGWVVGGVRVGGDAVTQEPPQKSPAKQARCMPQVPIPKLLMPRAPVVLNQLYSLGARSLLFYGDS